MDNHHSVYACEGTSLTIECLPGERIIILRANYGRLSPVVCNERRKTDGWNLQCYNSKAARIVADMCHESLQPCSIPANNRYFGDPCNLTPKYLEVQYLCQIVVSQSTASTYITELENTLATTVTDLRYVKNVEDEFKNDANHPPIIYDTFISTFTDIFADKVEAKVNDSVYFKTTTIALNKEDSNSDSSSDSKDIEDKSEGNVDLILGCPPTLIADIKWPRTVSDISVHELCPNDPENTVSWRCDLKTQKWIGQPDTSRCDTFYHLYRNELKKLQENFSIKDLDQVVSLLKQRANETALNGLAHTSLQDALALVSAASQLLDEINLREDGDRMEEWQVAARISNEGIFEMLDSLMNESMLNSCIANMSSFDNNTPLVLFSRIVNIIEAALFQMARATLQPTVYHYQKNYFVFELHVLNCSERLEDIIFPESDSKYGRLHGLVINNFIQFSHHNLQDYASADGLTRLVFSLHQNLHQLYDVQQHQVKISTQQNNIDSSKNFTLNSIIISASISEPFVSHPLKHPVIITLQHLNNNVKNEVLCVFLDGTIFNTLGCHLVSTNTTHSVCSCDHLTSFAVLMSLSNDNSGIIDGTHGFVLSLLTYLGCVVSIVSLMLAFIIFHFVRSLQCDRNTIHKNLALCLCIAEIIFLSGIIPFGNKVVCSVVAALLHYFFLCAFMWMLFEGIQIYAMIIEVFESSSRIICFYILAYLIPALIVITSAAVQPTGYGTPQFCWLSNENGFIWAFVGPVLFIITANALILSMAIYIMCRHSNCPSNHKIKKKKVPTATLR